MGAEYFRIPGLQDIVLFVLHTFKHLKTFIYMPLKKLNLHFFFFFFFLSIHTNTS